MTDERKVDLIENDCPISLEGWLTFLNSEINNLKYPDFTKTIELIIVFMLAFIGFMIASINTTLAPVFSSIWRLIYMVFAFITFIAFVSFFVEYYKIHNKVVKLKEIRDNIIYGELPNSNEVRKEWNKVEDSTSNLIFFKK